MGLVSDAYACSRVESDLVAVSTDTIKDSLPHTSRLTRLRVFDGSVLTSTGPSFYESCRNFTKIGVFGWYDL